MPQEDSFINPLYGHTVTFMVDGRRTNLAFTRTALSHVVRSGHRCTILDIDALYSSNSDYVLAPLSEQQTQAVEVLVPDPESDLESSIAELIGSGFSNTIMIDSLNSLYHLLSTGGRSYGGRKLAFVMACLSYLARAEKRAIFITMYRRERTSRLGGGRQISDLSNQIVSVNLADEVLTLRYDRGYSHSGNVFSLPIP